MKYVQFGNGSIVSLDNIRTVYSSIRILNDKEIQQLIFVYNDGRDIAIDVHDPIRFLLKIADYMNSRKSGVRLI